MLLGKLSRLEAILPTLLVDANAWKGLYVDYHPPTVERLWMALPEGSRLSLHRIHPCDPGDALFHPHPWPSAMKVLDGKYEMAIGYGSGIVAPPVAARIITIGGSSYEMSEPDAWHYVRPLGTLPTYSIMLTGKPWTREFPGPTHPLRPLNPTEHMDLINWFRHYYKV